jgi:hypothetical protein
LNYSVSRSLFERILFRGNGKPKKALRRLLFHKSGKPRGIFKSLIVHPDGRPHKPFRMWMMGPDYQKLPSAIQLGSYRAPDTLSLSDTGLSPRASELLARLEDRLKARH